MKLNDYPNAIAKLARKLQRMDIEIRHHQNLVERMTAQIERAIASDPELRNDQQRKARRLELMETSEYLQATEVLQAEQDKRDLAAIDLQLLRDNFRVAMLETRQAIAATEKELLIA
jgi:hypothetical protein